MVNCWDCVKSVTKCDLCIVRFFCLFSVLLLYLVYASAWMAFKNFILCNFSLKVEISGLFIKNALSKLIVIRHFNFFSNRKLY